MSKYQEALEILKNIQITTFGNSDLIESAYKEETETIEKALKALEIIKKKRVDVFELLSAISNSMYRNPLERYNSYVEGSFNTELTQEEFDLLKGILNDEQ